MKTIPKPDPYATGDAYALQHSSVHTVTTAAGMTLSEIADRVKQQGLYFPQFWHYKRKVKITIIAEEAAE